MKGRTKDKAAITTIEGGIRKNNKIMIKVMTALVVFTAISLLALGTFVLLVKNNGKSAIGMERATGIQSDWTYEVIESILAGTTPDAELDASKCEFAKWHADFDSVAIDDSTVQAAMDSILGLHEELHAIAKEAVGADAEARDGLVSELMNKQCIYSQILNTIFQKMCHTRLTKLEKCGTMS